MYQIVDSKTQKIAIVEMIKDPEMLRLVTDHLKNEKMCKHAVKKLPFLINYVPNNTRLYKCILENGEITFLSFPDRYKDQNMCNKAIDNYAHAL